MARPRKKGLDYFPFDTDFFENPKIVCLDGKFGPKGVLTAIKLLTAVYRKGYFLEWTETAQLSFLHANSYVTEGLLAQIIKFLLEREFFCRSLFESDNVITSVGIQQRYFEAAKFRKMNPRELPHLLIELPRNYAPPEPERVSQGLTAISQKKTAVSQLGNPQSKLNIYKNPSDDGQKPPPSPPPEVRLKNFISEAKSSQIWVDEMCKHCSLDKDTLFGLLDGEFTGHCIREGKEHRDINDFKSHFSRWFNRKKYSPPTTDYATRGNRGTDTGHAPKERTFNQSRRTAIQPACGLKRRPDS